MKFYKAILVPVILFCFVTQLHAQGCGVIYVVPGGATSGATAGTRANPADIYYALGSLAPANGKEIWMAVGNYPLAQPLQLDDSVTIEGGFDPTTWIKSNATPTVLMTSATSVIGAYNALVGIVGLSKTAFRIQDITLRVPDATLPAESVYGIYLNACQNYFLVRDSVITGNGAPGQAGAAGALGGPGVNGAPGAAFADENAPSVGGAGGVGGGGAGGTGADGGGWSRVYVQATAGSCTGGGAGGTLGNTPGSGPGCGCGLFGTSHNGGCPNAAPTVGGNGSPGGPGGAGSVGPAGTIVLPGYFVPGAQAGNGTPGTDGCGGGGGGGGGGRQQNGPDDVGGAGGGGGSGGQGGGGGTGGFGGGGSFAVFVYGNLAGGTITDCLLSAGLAGPGGAGGLGGIAGTPGTGGAGGAGFCGGASTGANGGDGGAGGAGGNGGQGAPGISAALEQSAGSPVTQTGTTVPGNPPVITVQNFGCTNAEVVFTSPTPGAWNFGPGANPATGNGTGPINVTYGTTGRETVTFAGTTFTDFVDIFSAQNFSNSIHASANPTISGCPDVFHTNIVASYYWWDFGALAIPAADSGAVDSNYTAYFLVPGSYTVSVYAQTACCGIVKDSTVVTVNTNTLNISLTERPSTPVCQGTEVVYNASPAGYQNYEFYINDSLVQSSATDSLITYALRPGDSVNVFGYNGTCYTNPSATAHPVIKPIPAPPTLTYFPVVDSSCGGDTITYTATPGYDDYLFSNGASLQDSSSNNVYITNSLEQGNTISVKAYKNGCESLISNIIAIIIKPSPLSLLNSPGSICQGNPDTLIAGQQPGSSYNFLVNGVSAQNSYSDTFISSGFNNGDVVKLEVTYDGCPSSTPATVTLSVRPTPSVTLTSSAAPSDTICQGSSIIFTASPTGDSLYTFFNGTTVVQNGPSPTYTTNTLATNSALSVEVVNYQRCPSIPSDTILTVVNPAPQVSAGTTPAPVCVDAPPVTIAGFNPPGGLWTGAGVTDPVNGVVTPSTAGAGTHEEVYSYDDPNTGCPGRDSLPFTVNPLPVIAIVPASPSICIGQSIQLQASGGTTYAWSPSTNLSSTSVDNPIANPSQTTTYQVTVTDANSCSASTTVTVTVNPPPTAGFSASNACAGSPIFFDNSSSPGANGDYTWIFGDGNTSQQYDPTHVYVRPDSFAVSLIAQLGNCYDTATNYVVVYPAVTANFSTNTLTSFNDSSDPVIFTNQSPNSTIWNWNFGDNLSSGLQNPSHVYSAPGVYTITLVASNQHCQDSIVKVDYINIYPLPALFIPNAFTPGQGSANNTLKVFTSGAVYFDWVIFDRWGEKVYQSNDPNQGWDGTYRGKPAAMGVYSYFLKIVFDDGQPRQYKGGVTLLR